MKNALFIVLVLISSALTSCTTNTITKENLPIEIVSLKETQKFDTILQIESTNKVYVFSKEREYKGVYKKTYEDGFPLGLFAGIAGVLFIVAIVFI